MVNKTTTLSEIKFKNMIIYFKVFLNIMCTDF